MSYSSAERAGEVRSEQQARVRRNGWNRITEYLKCLHCRQGGDAPGTAAFQAATLNEPQPWSLARTVGFSALKRRGPGEAALQTGKITLQCQAQPRHHVVVSKANQSSPGPPPKGWHSRDYLPHLDRPGLIQSLTFRLGDSVPAPLIEAWKHELNWHERHAADSPEACELRRKIAAYEDAGHGACWLREPHFARLVQEALWFFDGERYRLLAWCVMPNHVHVLVETVAGHSPGSLVRSWKRHITRQINIALARTGESFWAPDYYDRYIRDAAHYGSVVRYIEQNPVKAKLVSAACDWLWSSAAPGTAALQAATPNEPQPESREGSNG